MKWLFLILTLVSVQIQVAQNTIEFSNFNIVKVDDLIRIDFTLNSGSTCNGIYIERGSDSVNLFEIGAIAGQCGSPIEPVHYTFIDNNPILNSDNYYRLNFGGAQVSGALGLHFSVVEAKTVGINPNPSSGHFDLVFNNKLQEEWRVEIVNSIGEMVFETTTTNEKISIEMPDVLKGIFYVRVVNANNNSLISKGVAIIL